MSSTDVLKRMSWVLTVLIAGAGTNKAQSCGQTLCGKLNGHVVECQITAENVSGVLTLSWSDGQKTYPADTVFVSPGTKVIFTTNGGNSVDAVFTPFTSKNFHANANNGKKDSDMIDFPGDCGRPFKYSVTWKGNGGPLSRDPDVIVDPGGGGKPTGQKRGKR